MREEGRREGGRRERRREERCGAVGVDGMSWWAFENCWSIRYSTIKKKNKRTDKPRCTNPPQFPVHSKVHPPKQNAVQKPEGQNLKNDDSLRVIQAGYTELGEDDNVSKIYKEPFVIG